jgi:pimeloyl-ACP methyl ester carboxylesterase
MLAGSAKTVVVVAFLALGVAPPNSNSAKKEPATPAAEASAHPGQLARLPDGRRLNFRCAGAGAPTVLFEGGFAASSLAWYKVAPEAARTHRACAYDRAGYGFSDPGPEPRDGAATAKDLDDGLRAAEIPGPFVLVGHSAGGLYMRLFADRRPHQVIGMVLLDPSIEHQDQRFAAVFGPGAGGLGGLRARAAACLAAAEHKALPSQDPKLAACTPKPKPNQSAAVNAAQLAEAVRPSTWRTQLSELDSLWTTTSAEVDAGRGSYGDLPLIVLTADGTYAGNAEAVRARIDALWRVLHQDIAHRSTRGEERLVTNSSHMMMLDRPDVVTRAIDEVIAESQSRRSAPNRP